MQHLASCFLTILVILACAPAAHGEDLDVPPEKIEVGWPNSMMRRYLTQQAEQAIHRWKADYENRTTPEQIAAYQKRAREDCLKVIGGLPERTPLEPQITGTVSRPGYHVEKILFQSQPKHYVTALLFLPDSQRFPTPYPGVLVPCGHYPAAKGAPEYQSMGALLALNGMAALVFDPIDQGERAQYLGPNAPSPEIPWDTHCIVGTFRYAKRLYTRLGFAERVDILENDAGHNYNKVQREGVARWMSRWLLGKDQPIAEPPITLLTEQEYQCLPDGKVMTLAGARSVYDLNEDRENELAKRRAASWTSGN